MEKARGTTTELASALQEAASQLEAARAEWDRFDAALRAAKQELDVAKQKLDACLKGRSTSGRGPRTEAKCDQETLAAASADGKAQGLAQALSFEGRIAAQARRAVAPLKQARAKALGAASRVHGKTKARLQKVAGALGRMQTAVGKLVALPTGTAKELATAKADAAAADSALAACRGG